MKRSQLKTRYFKTNTEESLRSYKKQKNFCSKLYQKERKEYFDSIKLNKGTDNKTFWKTLKPFLSDKRSNINKITYTDNAGAQIGGRRGGDLPCPFLKIEKSALILEKKGPNCVHPWVEFSIHNVVLRVSRRKSSKFFPCAAIFLCF